jgi:hypothetical protein
MSSGIIGKFSRNALLFLGGVAVGYSIKVIIDDESFSQVKYSVYEMMHRSSVRSEDYIDVEVNE